MLFLNTCRRVAKAKERSEGLHFRSFRFFRSGLRAKAAGVYAEKGRRRSVDRGSVVRLKAEGRNPTVVAAELGINRVTVYRIPEEAAAGNEARA
jgi:DNA invertase Pin-like site-specific DNA recombinase